MGWSIGFDERWSRDIGYGVPALCDQPGCGKEIDRGLAYVCGGDSFGGDDGCGLFFCGDHMGFGEECQQCERCLAGDKPFTPTPDTAKWIEHKLTDPTWQTWRDQNPEEVARITETTTEVAA